MGKLVNASSSVHVAYKVKTTAPKAYLVRPSAGVLEPNKSVDVQIILQQTQTGEQASSHKFLVQAKDVPNNENVTREQWTEWASSQKDSIQEQRLNVQIEEKDSEPAVPTTSPEKGSSDMTEKYNELVKYTLSVEKEKKQLQAEIEKKKKSSVGDSGGYSLQHLLFVMLIAFIVPLLPKFLGK